MEGFFDASHHRYTADLSGSIYVQVGDSPLSLIFYDV